MVTPSRRVLMSSSELSVPPFAPFARTFDWPCSRQAIPKLHNPYIHEDMIVVLATEPQVPQHWGLLANLPYERLSIRT